jgi:hypothetical protein
MMCVFRGAAGGAYCMDEPDAVMGYSMQGYAISADRTLYFSSGKGR